jgi:hypothetical protein
MKLVEVSPLPERCLKCKVAKKSQKKGLTEDAYCYNCDFALERWQIVKDDEATVESDNMK